jgi:hypothetical protein
MRRGIISSMRERRWTRRVTTRRSPHRQQRSSTKAEGGDRRRPRLDGLALEANDRRAIEAILPGRHGRTRRGDAGRGAAKDKGK